MIRKLFKDLPVNVAANIVAGCSLVIAAKITMMLLVL